MSNKPVKRRVTTLPGGETATVEQLVMVTQIYFTIPPGMSADHAHQMLGQRLKWWAEDADNELRQSYGLFKGGDSDVEPCIATMEAHIRPMGDAAGTPAS